MYHGWNETIDKYPGKKWIYKLMCFFLLKKINIF